MPKCGVYKIRNIINNKNYIGSSVDIAGRFRDHRFHLNKENHKNRHLQSAWNKYGKASFEFTIIEECSEEELLKKEDKWMLYFNSLNRLFGYNLDTAERHIPSAETLRKRSESMKGFRHTEESKQKISRAQIGKKISEKTKKKLSEKLKGRKLSEETKRRMAKSKKGKTFSEEHKRRLSESHLGIRLPKFSDEHRQKISSSLRGNTNGLGHKVSLETRKKISEKNIGRIFSKETIKKMSAAKKDKILSEEHKRNLSISQKKRRLREKQISQNANIQEVIL